MSDKPSYLVALYRSVSHVIQSERILIQEGVPHRLVPVPKSISSECGVCIRFLPAHREDLERALEGKVDIVEIRAL